MKRPNINKGEYRHEGHTLEVITWHGEVKRGVVEYDCVKTNIGECFYLYNDVKEYKIIDL